MQHRHHGLDVLPGIWNRQAKAVENVLSVEQNIKLLRLACAVNPVLVSHGRQRTKVVLRTVPVQKIVKFQQIYRHTAHGKLRGPVVTQAEGEIWIAAGGIGQRDLLFVRHDGKADLNARFAGELVSGELAQRFNILRRLVDPHRECLPFVLHVRTLVHVA